MNPDGRPRVAIIGAGVSGLAAGWRLMQAGVDVTVFERSVRVGGRVYTDVVDGFSIEPTAQFFANFYTNTKALIGELGLQDQVVSIPGRLAILREDRLHKLWYDLRSIFTPLISIRSKLVLLKCLGPIITYWQDLDPHAMHKAHALDTQSVADYAQRHLNAELLEYLFQPPLTGIFYWTPERTSQAMFFTILKACANIRVFALRGGLAQLPLAMAERLSVRLGTEVLSVTPRGHEGYALRLRANGQESSFIADGVVCATTASVVPRIFDNLDTRQRSFFEAVCYCPSAIVAIGVAHRLPSNAYALYFPRAEVKAKYLAAATIESARVPGQIPDDRDLICLYGPKDAGHELLDRHDTAVRQLLMDDLKTAGTAYNLRDEVLHLVYRLREAIPEWDVGHIKRLKSFVDGEIEPSRVVFAGDYLGGPFVEGAITSGENAARRLLEQLPSAASV